MKVIIAAYCLAKISVPEPVHQPLCYCIMSFLLYLQEKQPIVWICEGAGCNQSQDSGPESPEFIEGQLGVTEKK